MSTLLVRGNELGVMKKGEFIVHTNFVFDVVASVEAPPNFPPCSGFIYSIRTTNDVERSVFISNTDAATPRTFVAAANRVIPSIQYVRMSETLWHRHIFNSCKLFHQSAANRNLLLATCLGRQPDSDVWVLTEDLQVEGDGQLIPEERQQYFWHSQYRPTGDSVMPPTLSIERPLSIRGIQNLCHTARQCLDNNFFSFYMALSGAVMGLHFQRVIDLHDECPIVMCYSALCGTGKTATLKAIKALFGDTSRLQRGKVSAKALLKLSSLSTIPISVDDISSAAKSEEIAVTFFNAAGHTTVANGTTSPLASVILSSNKSFIESDRNASRMVHVPFFQPASDLSEAEKSTAEEALKAAQSNASTSVGELIAVGQVFTQEKVSDCIQVVSVAMPRMGYKTRRNYAIVLAFAQILAENTGIVDCGELLQFATSTWIPEVLRIYHPSSNIIGEYFTGLLAKIQHLEVFEVLRFLRPNVTRDGGIKVVAIHLTDASTYYTFPNEDLLKQHIKKVGKTNVPLDFLRDTSKDTVVLARKNGKKKKCAVIPHDPSVPEEILQELYRVAGVRPQAAEQERQQEKERLQREEEELLQKEEEERQRREEEEWYQIEQREQETQRQRQLEDEERRLEEEKRLEEVRRLEEEKRLEEVRRLEEENLLSKQIERSLALLQPQQDKEKCPPMGCKITSRSRNVTWIACDSCDQWYHVKCVGLTAKKAEALSSWNCGLC